MKINKKKLAELGNDLIVTKVRVLIAHGFSDEKIEEITGLSKKRVEKIRKGEFRLYKMI